MKMNIPNQLTLFRMLMVPAFFVASMLEFKHHAVVALLIFFFACVTDFFDGLYARTHNQITVFGSLMDPVADKLITTSALFLFVYLGWCDMFVPIIILARDYLMTAVRIVASKQGVVIRANIWGKLKTIFQMVFSGLVLIGNVLREYNIFFTEAVSLPGADGQKGFTFTFNMFAGTLMWIVVICSIISGVTYYLQSRKLLESAESRKLLSTLVYEEFFYPALITGALVYFMNAKVANIITIMVIIAMSIIVTSFQMIATSQNVKLPIKPWNDLKMVKMLLLTVMLLLKILHDLFQVMNGKTLSVIGNVIVGLLAVLSIAAGIIFMVQSKKKIDFSK